MVDALTGWLMPCRATVLSPAGFGEVRKAEAGQGQGDCQAGPGREVRVRAWLSAIARLRESHGASWGRVALARPSGNVLVCGGRGRGAHRGVRYVVHCFDSRGCLGRQDEGRGHRRVFSHPSGGGLYGAAAVLCTSTTTVSGTAEGRVNNSERISCVELAVRPLRRVLLLVWGRERDNSDAGRQQRR